MRRAERGQEPAERGALADDMATVADATMGAAPGREVLGENPSAEPRMGRRVPRGKGVQEIMANLEQGIHVPAALRTVTGDNAGQYESFNREAAMAVNDGAHGNSFCPECMTANSQAYVNRKDGLHTHAPDVSDSLRYPEQDFGQ